jgi:hypothetical protein
VLMSYVGHRNHLLMTIIVFLVICSDGQRRAVSRRRASFAALASPRRPSG